MRESGLTFDFAAEWIVVRYDRHRFYKYLSGRGFRGVDFVLLHRTEARALLIEVKNYRYRHGRQIPEKLLGYLRDPAPFVRHLARKYVDTRAAFDHVAAWYQRQWWWPITGAPSLALARRPGSGFRENDRSLFALLHAEVELSYLVVLELEAAYPGVDEERLAGFGESLQEDLRAMGLPAAVGPEAELRRRWQ